MLYLKNDPNVILPCLMHVSKFMLFDNPRVGFKMTSRTIFKLTNIFQTLL